jgi:hypothetical protein
MVDLSNLSEEELKKIEIEMFHTRMGRVFNWHKTEKAKLQDEYMNRLSEVETPAHVLRVTND